MSLAEAEAEAAAASDLKEEDTQRRKSGHFLLNDVG